MGILDFLGDAGDAIGKYFADGFTESGHTFRDAWTKTIPESAKNAWSAGLAMAQMQFHDSDEAGKAFRTYLDNMTGLGGGVLGGTFGGLFAAPGLNSVATGLDKAYRYAVARPFSWQMLNLADAANARAEARARGESGVGAILGTYFNGDIWFGDRGMWSDSVGKATPGQALVYELGSAVGQLNPGNTNDPTAWAKARDPRTEQGQAAYNSDNAEFLLKYGSGTVDLLANMVADPSELAAVGIKAGRAKYRHVATESYVEKGKHEAEVGTKQYEKFYAIAKDAPTPEHLRSKTNLTYAPLGGSASVVLWAAAKHADPGVFRDAYIVARGIDGGFGGGRSLGAWGRLQDASPGLASDMARLFANWNIGEDATHLGKHAAATGAVQSLVANDMDAFLAAVASYEGIIGTLPGKLMNTAQPKVARIRPGVRSWAMNSAPVFVGKPIARAMRGFQGWTPFIDSEDSSALALQQFKDNLERSGASQEFVNHWVSQWSAKGSREGRNLVHEQAEAAIIKWTAEKLGLTPEVIKGAVADVNRYRAGARQVMQQQRMYVSERAARLGARYVVLGRHAEARALKELSKDLSDAAKKGLFGDRIALMPNLDGRAEAIALPDSGELPAQAADPSKPLLLSQTEPLIPTIDFRALQGQLKWWKRAHPMPMIDDPVTGKRRVPVTPEERAEATIRVSPLKSLAKLHGGWDALITGADYANMLWKSSALLRPAQMPRNLADDTLRRYLIFGKAHMILGAATGAKRTFQNAGRRGVYRHEAKEERKAKRGADRTRTAVVTTAEPETAPQTYFTNEEQKTPGGRKKTVRVPLVDVMVRDYGNIGAAWMSGAISFDDFIHTIEYLMVNDHLDAGMRNLVPGPLQTAMDARSLRVESRYENPAEMNSRKPPLPRSKIFHSRAFKRRIIEYYFGQTFTKFLDDLRVRGQEKNAPVLGYETDPETGRRLINQPILGERSPIDPKLSGTDYRQTWLAQVISDHVTGRHHEIAQPGVVGHAEARPDVKRGLPIVPYRQGQFIVDPFNGEEIPGDYDVVNDFTIMKHETLDIRPTITRSRFKGSKPTAQTPELKRGGPASARIPSQLSEYHPEAPSMKLMNFMVDNIDLLLKPKHRLSLTVTPEGNIRAGIARLKDDVPDKGPLSSRQSAEQRLKNFHVDGILDSGHTDIEIRLKDGGIVRFPAAFGGPNGQAMQHRVSSSTGAGAHMLITGDTNMSRILDQMGGWGIVRPNERGYAQSWERAVNAQLASDPVARMYLEGRSDADVFTWLENTSEGTKYLHRMHYFGTHYIDHARQIKGMVDEYVPLGPSTGTDATKEGRALREAVLEKRATHDMLAKVEQEMDARPEVHGASMQYTLGKGAVFDMVSRGIDKAQKYLSDLPVDKLSRFPFFAESYRRHLTSLVKTADAHYFKNDDYVPGRLMYNLEQQARELALYDTKYHLYDVAQLNDVARFMRLVVPFSSAMADAYIKYARIIRESPGAVLQGAYYWEMFERNEQVQDENGNILEKDSRGIDHWYSVDPKTGQRTEVTGDKIGGGRYVVFRFPSDLEKISGHLAGPGPALVEKAARSLYGTKALPVMAINKKSFNVFLDLPSTGPLVALPANEFALSNPAFGDSKIIKQFVLPFGPSTDRGKVFVPGSVRTAWEAFTSTDGLKAEVQAKAIFQAELIAYSRGERETPPSFDEVRGRAQMMKYVRFATSFGSPLAIQYNSPYQPWLNAYRQMVAVNPDNADEHFLAQYGDEMYAVAMSVTRNVGGIPATLNGDAARKRYADMIAQFPDLAGLIVGSDGAGAFSKSVYEAQKTQEIRPGDSDKMREVVGLEDSVKDLQKRHIWQQYSNRMDEITSAMADRGLASLRGAAAADLAAARDKFINDNMYWTDPVSGQQAFSPWYDDFTTTDNAQIDKRIEQMWQIVQDPGLQKRDDIRGLIDYLSMREATQRQMAENGFQTLGSQQAADLRQEWESTSFALIESNPTFGALWNRWLSNDTELTLGGAIGG